MKRDSVYLAHILEEMEFLQTNFADRSCEEIVQNEMMKRSVLRSLEVIGEASKNLSSVVRARYPDIPWNGMARMRDRLIHGYFSVRWEIVLDWYSVRSRQSNQRSGRSIRRCSRKKQAVTYSIWIVPSNEDEGFIPVAPELAGCSAFRATDPKIPIRATP